MKQHFTATKFVLLLAVTAASICISGFREKDSTQRNSFRTPHDGRDTTPSGKRDRNSDIELDRAMEKLDIELRKLDEKMKNMDFSKIQKSVDESLKKIDFEKIGKDVEEAMAKVDWKKINSDVQAAMEKVQKVDMVKLQEDMKKVTEDIKNMKIDINIDHEKIQKDVNEAMKKAKVSIDKAMVEVKQMQEFIDALDADKLIDKKKAYKIEIKDGELFINDTKQSKEVSDKYRKYFKKDNYSIHNDGESIQSSGSKGVKI